ncbi:hypothetical protein DNTS_004364 [Danionella cerebrum]|uniref:Uncharacterized protein n=1 Tax=Danionella cerebrum TaxID=2873325 RepID=A0A553P948_9TELE|nr:hypothetical protein DNTS_004364 [Danionella translucida]
MHLIQQAFSEDFMNPLVNQLMFTFEGLPSKSLQNLRPVLLPDIKTTSDHNLDFDINCGHDDICVDDLRMDFNFSGSTNIEVGIKQEINVTVLVENRGENSLNPLLTLKYPYGLSYRRITAKQNLVECVSLDGEQRDSVGVTTCYISKPILKGNARALFRITYNIDKESSFDQNVIFRAEINSRNSQHSQTSELLREKSIGVKYGIYIALIRHEDSSLHINFTADKNDLEKPVKQILKVENDFRELSFSVLLRVPLMLGNQFIWTDGNLQIADCMKQLDDPQVRSDFLEVFKKDRVLNCSVAVCAVFRCDVTLSRNERTLFNISGNVSSAWIEQISTQVEVFEEVDLTKQISAGVLGGLLLLALITTALHKAGFFKSRYKQLLETAEQNVEE